MILSGLIQSLSSLANNNPRGFLCLSQQGWVPPLFLVLQHVLGFSEALGLDTQPYGSSGACVYLSSDFVLKLVRLTQLV